MGFRVIALGHGCLLGFQFFPREHEDDYNEFNIYLLLFCLSWKWE